MTAIPRPNPNASDAAACQRKARYYGEARAREVADRRARAEERIINVYECPECGWWHLTKRPPTSAPNRS